MRDVTGCHTIRPSPLHWSALAPGNHGIRFSGTCASKPIGAMEFLGNVSRKCWKVDRNIRIRPKVWYSAVVKYQQMNDHPRIWKEKQYQCHKLSVVHVLQEKNVLKTFKGYRLHSIWNHMHTCVYVLTDGSEWPSIFWATSTSTDMMFEWSRARSVVF